MHWRRRHWRWPPQSIEADGPADGVAITNQRASTVVWNPATGRAVAPGQGWQDLRTVGDCLVLAADGLRLAPNHSATKVANILGQVDPDRSTGLLSGTIDTWLAWSLSGGSTFVTDASNASLTGLATNAADAWNAAVLDALNIPPESLATIGDSLGALGTLDLLPGAPPLLAVLGDQQASMIGQGAVVPDAAKITFGTGGMLDVCTPRRPGRQCLAPPPGAFPSPGGPPVGNAPGRWRRSCCRRAPTWSGCATTWASSTTQPSPTSWRHRWMMPTVWCSCRHRWVWARPTGLRRPQRPLRPHARQHQGTRRQGGPGRRRPARRRAVGRRRSRLGRVHRRIEGGRRHVPEPHLHPSPRQRNPTTG
jgi:hypothetical protein